MKKQIQSELLATVKKNYAAIAEDFSETRKKYLWPELIKLTDPVEEGSQVLDAGCGSGRLSVAFKNKKIKYLGVDNSEELIAIAKKEFENKNFQFKTADLLHLSMIEEAEFDYIFCIAALHHLPGRDLQVKALKQLKNKIKKDGQIIITVWNLWSQEKYRKIIFRFFLLKLLRKNKMDFGDIIFDWKDKNGQNISRRYYHAFTKNELKKIVKQAGLSIKEIYKDEYNYYLILTCNT